MTRIESYILKANPAKQCGIVILTIAASSLFIAFGMLIRHAIDNQDWLASSHGVILFCGVFILIRAAMPIAYAFIEALTHDYCIVLEATLRAKTFKAINVAHFERSEKPSKAESLSIYDSAMSSISSYARTLWNDFLPIFFQVLFIAGSISFYLDAIVSSAFLLAIICYGMTVLKLTNNRFSLMRNAAIAQKKMKATTQNLYEAELSSRLFDIGDRLDRKLESCIAHHATAQKKVKEVFLNFGAITTICSVLGSIVVLAVAVCRYSTGAITPGSLIMLATFLFQIFLPLNRLGVLWRTIHKARIDFNLIDSVLPALHDQQSNHFVLRSSAVGNQTIQIINLSKAKGDKDLFCNINEEIVFILNSPSFLTGRNGQGKTTLARLICGVEKPDCGEIYFNKTLRPNDGGGSASEWTALSWQAIIFIDGTVRENMVFFLGTIDEYSVSIVASALGFGKHLDFYMGEQGNNLSAGERHKLSIMMAIEKKSAFLILDEPTVNLDASAVRGLKDLIKGMLASTPTLIISHDQDFISSFPEAPIYEVSDKNITSVNDRVKRNSL